MANEIHNKYDFRDEGADSVLGEGGLTASIESPHNLPMGDDTLKRAGVEKRTDPSTFTDRFRESEMQ